MAISYPLTTPTIRTHSAIKWLRVDLASRSTSPFNGKSQVFDYGCSYWQIDAAFDPMDREEAAQWIAFFASLRGPIGTFYYGDILTATARGSVAGTGRIKGGNQVGFVLETDSWTPNILLFRSGDRIQINDSLYQIMKDVSSDGSGEATLDVWPHLKPHADNTTVTYSNAKGIFRLVPSSDLVEDMGRSQLWSVSFQATEAL